MTPDNKASTADTIPPSVSENIETIAAFYARHKDDVSRSQTMIEKISLFMGSPTYVAANVAFIICWICANPLAPFWGWTAIDPPPFFWLQGVVGVNTKTGWPGWPNTTPTWTCR